MELAPKKNVECVGAERRSAPTEIDCMNFLFSPPSLDDLTRLLKAWRFWVLGAILGALIGAAVYYVVPPPYRATATVVVDFNLEEAWPQDNDREQFYYLQRETRKLRETAWSDVVMEALSSAFSIPVNELREEKLSLSQPSDGAWHFHASDSDPRRAQQIASAWAQAFVQDVRQKIAETEGLNSFIEVEVTQAANLPVERGISLSVYLFSGAIGLLAVSAFLILFFNRPK